MSRTCPSCQSLDTRPSSVRGSEITLRHIFFSPYRCRNCRTRFWVISRNAYYFAGIMGLALAVAAGAIVWNMHAWLEAPRAEKVEADATPPRLADLIKLADGNDAAAEYTLAQMYGSGFGVPKSAMEEHRWLQRSAQHGNVQAQFELGIALRDGRGTVQDYEEAQRWLQRAAEGGNAKAQYSLGLMYRAGKGVPVDDVKAYVWLNVAAAQDVPGAASARDAVLVRLSAAELLAAQAEARRMSALYIPKVAPAR